MGEQEYTRKLICCHVSEAVHRRFKAVCVAQDTTMTAAVETLVQRFLQENEHDDK